MSKERDMQGHVNDQIDARLRRRFPVKGGYFPRADEDQEPLLLSESECVARGGPSRDEVARLQELRGVS